jgi:hypothetical protein
VPPVEIDCNPLTAILFENLKNKVNSLIAAAPVFDYRRASTIQRAHRPATARRFLSTPPLGLEGIVFMHRNHPYRSAPNKTWLAHGVTLDMMIRVVCRARRIRTCSGWPFLLQVIVR